jgi:hypothetical protein
LFFLLITEIPVIYSPGNREINLTPLVALFCSGISLSSILIAFPELEKIIISSSSVNPFAPAI